MGPIGSALLVQQEKSSLSLREKAKIRVSLNTVIKKSLLAQSQKISL